MTLFAGPDDFPARVQASGLSAQAYAVSQHRERVKRLYSPANAVTDDEVEDRLSRKLAEGTRRIEAAVAAKEAEINAKYRKLFWRMSWLEMCRMASLVVTAPVDSEAQDAKEQRKFARDIMREVCAKHGIDRIDFISPRRVRRLCAARMEFYWRCKQETTLSYPQIGRICGRRDHTTVLHGARKYQERIDAGEV